jgi:4-hydroxy-tetrahydrodipicolinate synthase
MRFDGIIPAIVMPMQADGAVDEKALRNYLKWLLPQGPVALAINTDAGEGPQLRPDEKLRILEVVAGEVAGQVPIVSGLGGVDTDGMLDFGRKAKQRGADGWLLFPHPAWRGARGKDAVVIEYHQQAARLGLPIILFQLQAELGGVELPHETLAELVKIDEVKAIKEATFNAFKYQQTVEFLRGLPKRIAILTGNDNFILESFILGGDGALIGFGAILLKEQVRMIGLQKKGKLKEALKLYERINPMAQATFASPVRDYRARLKEVLRLQGVLPNSNVRRPLLPLSSQEKAALVKVMKKTKFL